MILTAPGGKIPKDKSWKAAKIMMGKVDTFLDSLKKFDKEHIPEACLKAFKYVVGGDHLPLTLELRQEGQAKDGLSPGSPVTSVLHWKRAGTDRPTTAHLNHSFPHIQPTA